MAKNRLPLSQSRRPLKHLSINSRDGCKQFHSTILQGAWRIDLEPGRTGSLSDSEKTRAICEVIEKHVNLTSGPSHFSEGYFRYGSTSVLKSDRLSDESIWRSRETHA